MVVSPSRQAGASRRKKGKNEPQALSSVKRLLYSSDE
jgi:hypothetical protein